MVRMGSVQPDYLKPREYIEGIPGASAQDSFQTRLGLIFREHAGFQANNGVHGEYGNRPKDSKCVPHDPDDESSAVVYYVR